MKKLPYRDTSEPLSHQIYVLIACGRVSQVCFMADISGVEARLDSCSHVRHRLRTFGRLLIDVTDLDGETCNVALKPTLENLVLNRRQLEPLLERMALHDDTRAPTVDNIFDMLKILYQDYPNCVQTDTDLQREMWDVKRFCGRLREAGTKLPYKPLRDTNLANFRRLTNNQKRFLLCVGCLVCCQWHRFMSLKGS